MHVDTGLNFPEVLAYRDRWVEKLGLQLVVASVPDAIERGLVQRGAQRLAQPDPDAGAARGGRAARLRRPVRRRAPRRGEGAGEGAGVLVPRRVRPVGPEEPAARALEPLQRPRPPRPEHPRVPAVELDRARHLDLHRRRGRSRSRRPVPRRASARSSSATGCCTRSTSSRRCATARRPTASASATGRSATPTSPRRSSPTPTRVEKIVAEIAAVRITERGATRGDDKVSETSMEDRKREGYF